MKNLSLFIVLIALVLFTSSSFCQQELRNKQIIQVATGKDKIIFTVFDYETKEPLIGAAIYSFNLKKILATTDIDGVAITEKELKGNLEISYIGYYPYCFKLLSKNIDSVIVQLKSIPPPPDIYVVDTLQKVDSSFFYGGNDARLDLEEGKIQLFTDKALTEEQNTYAEKHDFKFELWAGNNYYREAYNEVVIDFLNKKFERNIEEELREICWRNHHP
jgi:hypothetical protein